MKITIKQFALSLFESVDGPLRQGSPPRLGEAGSEASKPAASVRAAIKKFVELLAGRSQLTKADKIIKEFIKIWNEKHGIVEAEVVSARGLDKETGKLLKNYITGLSGAKEVLVSEKTDKNILGGVIIKYGDKVLDGSLKTSLDELKEKMIK